MKKEFFIAAMFSCIGYVSTNITDINPYDKVISVYTPDNILHINPRTHQVYTEDGSVDTVFRKYSEMVEFIEDYTYESVAYLQDIEEEEIFNQKVYSKAGSVGELMYLSDDKIVFDIDGVVFNVMKIKGKWFDHLSREYNVYTTEMSNGDIVYSVVSDAHNFYYFTIDIN